VATLETPRLVLRSWRDSDIDPWVEMSADPRVMEHFPNTYTRAQSEASLIRMRERLEREGHGWWPIEVKGGTSFAGVIVLQEIPFDSHFTPAMEVGWWLAYDHWGKGYATEGARAALAYAFGELQRSEIVAITTPVNVRSQRVMERLGMTRDPADDFDNPYIAAGHPLRRHVLYRTRQAPSG
jgi:RimJ/RimL family protein N-acetyltransferase